MGRSLVSLESKKTRTKVPRILLLRSKTEGLNLLSQLRGAASPEARKLRPLIIQKGLRSLLRKNSIPHAYKIKKALEKRYFFPLIILNR